VRKKKQSYSKKLWETGPPSLSKEEKKRRLNILSLQLLAKLPSKSPVDLSYLLERERRQRKKTLLLNS